MIIICIFMIGTAFFCGRWSTERAIERLATLRPAIDDPPPAHAASTVKGAVFTTRVGKYWHTDARCRYLDTAQVMARIRCPRCCADGDATPAGVAETPPGGA